MGESITTVAPFIMVIAIVAIVMGSRVARTYLMTRGRRESSRADDAMTASMQAQIDKLQDRVAVLEKLATDEDRKLAGEIERLRDRTGARY